MQNTPIRTTGRQFAILEPVIHPEVARELHGVVKPASASSYDTYPMGQVMVQKNDGSNLWAKMGTSGYGAAGNSRPRLLKYPIIVNDAGQWQIGPIWFTVGGDIHEGSVDMFYKGFFKISELTGNAGGGVNAVQTETLGVGVDGGTLRIAITNPITGEAHFTDPLAWNATAAVRQAALEALPNVEVNDVIVSGSAGGPYTYTFSGGNYAGRPVADLEIETFNLKIGSVSGGGTDVILTTTAGVSGSKNEVQTETVTATGGTRTLTITNPNTGEAQTTGAIAYNANAATIQAALEGLSNVAVGDVVVSGTGPYLYTFGGNYAGKNIAAIVVGVGSLTGGTSTVAETTAGVDDLSTVGAIVQTYPIGIIELGAATPV